jgi:uncharacterized protein involved in exopolysaccharide biosynthesis
MPTQSSEISNIAAALNPFSGSQFRFGTASDEVLTYIGILKSRTVREATIRKFNLLKEWKIKDIDKALRIIDKKVTINLTEEGLVEVSALAKTRQMSADIANFYVEKLNEINVQLATQNAHANKVFLEERVREIEANLADAEEKMRLYQEKYGAFSISDQTRAIIETAAEIQAKYYALDVEVKVLQNSLRKDHPELLNKQLELEELKKKMREMEIDDGAKNRPEWMIPFQKIPEVGVEIIRLIREVTKYNTILEFLYPQLEQARIEEVKNTPTIQVVDTAVPPIRKDKPKRSVITLAILFVGMVMNVLYIMVKEKLFIMKKIDVQTYGQLKDLCGELKADLTFFRRKKPIERN